MMKQDINNQTFEVILVCEYMFNYIQVLSSYLRYLSGRRNAYFLHSNYLLNLFRALWPCDIIWRHKSRSTLAQVMAYWLTAPSHYWTNVGLSSVGSSGTHLRAILQAIPQSSGTEISLKITYLTFCSHLPGANELNQRKLHHLPGADISVLGVPYRFWWHTSLCCCSLFTHCK